LSQQGVDREDLVRVARAVAYNPVFSMLYYLGDVGACGDAVGRLLRWRLVDTDEDGPITGRTVDGLFESLLSMDPSGTYSLLPCSSAAERGGACSSSTLQSSTLQTRRWAKPEFTRYAT
jgi:hypothetical protein